MTEAFSLTKGQKEHDARRDELARRMLKMPRLSRNELKIGKARRTKGKSPGRQATKKAGAKG